MYLVLSYDIVSNRRRRRIHKLLTGFLRHVQKSVFEGELSDRGYEDLRHVLGEEMDPEEDNVRIYRLCNRCRPATVVLGTAFRVEEPGQDLLF